jgi:hypothetical protein
MPKATASVVEPERHELKTLPGGYVVVRRLTYGQKLERRAMVSNATAEMSGRNTKGMKMSMQMMNEQATIFDFTHCIVEHNLEGDNEEQLNLSSPVDVRRLDPRVGEEIERVLDKMNNFDEEDEELGN